MVDSCRFALQKYLLWGMGMHLSEIGKLKDS